MDTGELDQQIASVAALAEPHRRNLYRLVVDSEQPVSKDAAAEALGLPRSVVTFHLERLVTDGLLVAEYRRLSGRTGPGAGRPAKLYRRSDQQITVTLPPRRDSLAADMLAAAVTGADAPDTTTVLATLARVAHDRGRSWSGEVDERAGPGAGCADVLAAALDVLAEKGFEPRFEADEVTLVNCPFHALVDRHRELICSMNRDLLAGLCAGLSREVLSARLEPSDDRCCVRLTRL